MNTLLEQFLNKPLGIRVFALVGKSGTGKSFRARLLAERYRIPLIVDDGLLIRNQTIITGVSAKTAPNYLAAIKMAIFSDPARRREMIQALGNERFSKILLLGTSEKMVRKVQEQLELPPVYKLIHIEDIASDEEIARAQAERGHGRHVIPVPALALKKEHGHILQGSFFVFFDRAIGIFRKRKAFEKSIVQPTFHPDRQASGRLLLSESALGEMITHCVAEFDSALRLKRIKAKAVKDSYRISLFLEAPYGKNLTGALRQLQDFIIQHIERYTGVRILAVDVEIVKIS